MRAGEFFRPIMDVTTGEPPPPLEHHILARGFHMLLYAFGGSGKGVIAAWIAAQLTKEGVVVGILDFEDNAEEWRARIERFGGHMDLVRLVQPVPEGALSGALWDQAEVIRDFVRELGIEFLIIDSVLPAAQVTGSDIGAPDLPTNYQRALKTIGGTTLSLGHAAGTMKRESLAKPWGSHQWRNTFRLTWAAWQQGDTLDVWLTKTNQYPRYSFRLPWAWARELGAGETPPDLEWSEVDASTADAAGVAGAAESLESYLEARLVRAAEELAPDGVKTIKRDKLWDWLAANNPPGKKGSSEQRYAALHRAITRDLGLDRVVEVNTGKKFGNREVMVYRFATADEEVTE